MKIAHLDNPSLSALSASETLTHPMHSFPHYHMPVIFESTDYKATCFSFASDRAAPRVFAGQAWIDMTQYEGHKKTRGSRAAQADTVA